ncbi:MAG: SDR family NAD(P)-dependent oxidoreductase, partial [Deltaproteobacteria bacterium]|nr:SDR family NAD(P)-dependent oxidoreductase [Deltaproteobacteria bacterium]
MTGGASGIGRATVQRLATDGAAVVVNFIGGREPADDLVGQIREVGGSAVAIEADVADEQQVIAMFRQARERLGGPVDVLVNNAGVEQPFRLVDMPLDEWNK